MSRILRIQGGERGRRRGLALVVVLLLGAAGTEGARGNGWEVEVTMDGQQGTGAPPSGTVSGPQALFASTDEFLGIWNQAVMRARAPEGRPAVRTPLDPAAVVLRPAGGGMSTFDFHVPALGYIGGLVQQQSGRVFNYVVAGDPQGVFLPAAAGAGFEILLAQSDAEERALVEKAWADFLAGATAGQREFVQTERASLSLLAFGGEDTPWVALVVGPRADRERSLADAQLLTRLVGSTGEPPVPVP